MRRSLLCGILEMSVGAISFLGVYFAIAVVWNFEDEGWGDRNNLPLR